MENETENRAASAAFRKKVGDRERTRRGFPEEKASKLKLFTD